MHVLEATTRVPAPLNDVFGFFSDPGNLARITPPWLRFRIQPPAPERLEEGARIEYRIRWLVFTLRWVTVISGWVAGVEFQDRQERGPYRTWIHTHRFEPDGAGVLMGDRVEYELPFGVLGRLAHTLLVRRQLHGIFDYRRQAIEKIFPAAGR
ncbi:MAG: SRPBCC family protein [Acidobacteria bacterium]|nr:SRPBCC family protein [Acidobacteriota bacterium]